MRDDTSHASTPTGDSRIRLAYAIHSTKSSRPLRNVWPYVHPRVLTTTCCPEPNSD